MEPAPDRRAGDAIAEAHAAVASALVRAVTASIALAVIVALAGLWVAWPAIAAAPPLVRIGLLAICAVALSGSAFCASRAWHLATALHRPPSHEHPPRPKPAESARPGEARPPLSDAAAGPLSTGQQARPTPTDRKVRLPLSDTDARLAGVIASAMDAIITVDSEHRVVLFNAMAEVVFGWRAEEMMGQKLDRLLPGRFRAVHAQHVETFARTGATARVMGRTGQLTALRRDGSEFPIEATISQAAVRGEQLLTVILRDVSERLRAEQEVRQANARLTRYARRLEALQEIDRAVLGATRLEQLTVAALGRLLPIVSADEVDVVLRAEGEEAREHRVSAGTPPRVAVLSLPGNLQREVDEWLGTHQRRVDDLADPDNPTPEPLRTRHNESGFRSYLGTPLTAHGRLVGRLDAWSRSAAAFGEEAMEVTREAGDQLAVAIEQAKMRADLHRHAEDLEARVAQRTQALQDVNAELNSFAYSVSHDLRTPLRSMQGFAEALLEDYGNRLDETGHDYAKRIVAASRRMDQLIQDLLTYSRLSRAELELQPVALDPLLKGVAIQVEEQAQAATPERLPTIEVLEPLPIVVGHRGVLTQVFVNLLTNATKFVAPEVTPHVTVSAETRQDRVRVTVADNGIGIAEEHQERIFRVFERLHRLDAYPGTGIGLAIVRKGIDRLGGRSGVDSSPGQGSCFWVELPAADPGAVPTGDPLV
jgi:PAS domain S-box-containing protein